MKEKITIIADDFGLNLDANRLIAYALNRKVIDGASLLINLPATGDALKKIQRFKINKKIGWHLNLTEGQPILPAEQVKTLVGKDRQFLGWSIFLLKTALNMVNRAQIVAETKAQLKKFRSEVGEPIFLNSHHHIHLFPPLVKVISPVVASVPDIKIRLPRKYWRPSFSSPHAHKSLAIQLFGASQKNWLPPLAQYFADLDWAGETSINRREFLRLLPSDTELACHPLNFSLTSKASSTLGWLIKAKNLSK